MTEQEMSVQDLPNAPKAWYRVSEHPDAHRPWPEVLREHMAAAGIESVEELWEWFTATGENLQRWRFERCCAGTYGSTGARYIRGVAQVLGYEYESEEAGRISFLYFNSWRHKDRLPA